MELEGPLKDACGSEAPLSSEPEAGAGSKGLAGQLNVADGWPAGEALAQTNGQGMSFLILDSHLQIVMSFVSSKWRLPGEGLQT